MALLNDQALVDVPPELRDPLTHAVARRDADILNTVSLALENGNVALAYQPVLQARAPDRIAYYEGLIRIFDETGRVIPAADFIHAAEVTELGRRIDCAALSMGLRVLEDTPEIRLALNLSARSIGYPRWMRILRKALMRDPALGERLILEITEGSAMMIPELVTSFMTRMRRHGISFALDDFGAGHTSFRYLRDFLFDILKIDGQFIRGVATDPDNQVLARALIAIARHMDMLTVAEQVETPEDAQWITRAGIDCVQGYCFAAPTIRPPWEEPPAAETGS
ncbi:EAL domain protein [Pseudooceanicola batsensis HTCC2597]|uniref:EAL domain protein n=1 Tax=Pseudooceanicola batsensis (strain ATCC BAA-863 / DSM 15984 / KCTC 12145 / HTCC2597) TaxID=252305 RepID=A3TV66_PSEBH|nr:EAL domain-containing protein [Pseudooceanicola batsensis]EAQ04412.1 EAL domain protein [Pseudooceanicola batsensis HTCC2597]